MLKKECTGTMNREECTGIMTRRVLRRNIGAMNRGEWLLRDAAVSGLGCGFHLKERNDFT